MLVDGFEVVGSKATDWVDPIRANAEARETAPIVTPDNIRRMLGRMPGQRLGPRTVVRCASSKSVCSMFEKSTSVLPAPKDTTPPRRSETRTNTDWKS